MSDQEKRRGLPEWADDAFLRIFDGIHWKSQADNLKHPRKIIIQRALEGFLTAHSICIDNYPLPNSFVPMWMPVDSYQLMQRKLEDKRLDPGLLHMYQKILTFDYDRAKQILTFHNLDVLIIIATRALVRLLHYQTETACLSDGTGRTWRMFNGDQHPRFPNGSDTRMLNGQRFHGWTEVRMPAFALFYAGPRQNENYPDLVVEVASREKAAALEERARWYMKTSRGETRMVFGLTVDEDVWSMTLWRLGDGGGPEEDARYRVVDTNGHAGLAIPIRDLIPPMAVRAIEESDCRATVATLDHNIVVDWDGIMTGFKTWVELREAADEREEEEKGAEERTKVEAEKEAVGETVVETSSSESESDMYPGSPMDLD